MARENGRTTLELNKVVLYIVITIALAMFVLGYLSRAEKQETVTFTYEEIQMIESFQKQITTENSKAQVIVYKDKKGNLMLGWED